MRGLKTLKKGLKLKGRGTHFRYATRRKHKRYYEHPLEGKTKTPLGLVKGEEEGLGGEGEKRRGGGACQKAVSPPSRAKGKKGGEKGIKRSREFHPIEGYSKSRQTDPSGESSRRNRGPVGREWTPSKKLLQRTSGGKPPGGKKREKSYDGIRGTGEKCKEAHDIRIFGSGNCQV